MHRDLKGRRMLVPLFPGHQTPNGFLTHERESHALWYYYLCARNAYETIEQHAIVIEGDPDPTTNYLQLFKSIATMYNVRPENMANCWPQVDMQCQALGLPPMPEGDKYRFNVKIKLN